MKKIENDKINRINGIINLLEKDTSCYEFKFPVNWKKLGINHYPRLIKKPMDLSTIKKKINQNKYKEIKTIIDDINLIWSNCKIFNLIGSVNKIILQKEIYKNAEYMEKLANKLYDSILNRNEEINFQNDDIICDKDDDYSSTRDESNLNEDNEKIFISVNEKNILRGEIRKLQGNSDQLEKVKIK